MTSESTGSWEYKTVAHPVSPKEILEDGSETRALTDVLTEHGADGWELVNFSPVTIGSTMGMNSETQGFVFVLKRRVNNS